MSTRISSGSLPVVASVLVLISSACCIGPLAVVLSLVGLTSGTMLAVENVVGPFRLLILSATVLFLGVGFYAAYRKQEIDCEDGKVCTQLRRWFRDRRPAGTAIIIGAQQDDDRGTNAGAAYIYRRLGISWVEEAKITAFDAHATDYFGVAVDLRALHL